MKKVLFVLALATMVFVSCGKDKEDSNLAQQMLGKWMLTQVNGRTVPTNEKVVITFVSDTQGYISAARVINNENHLKWANHMSGDVMVEGDRISMFGNFNKTTSFTAIIDVKSISDTEIMAELKYTVYLNGESLYETGGTVLCTKVETDFSNEILGTWEGRVTSAEGSEFDDGELHRWEYLADGTYVYYQQDENGQWVSNTNEMSEYFVDGILLCTRWRNTNEEEDSHEWWEIASIENGVMNWTALRQREDGTSYTATFSMTRVQ